MSAERHSNGSKLYLPGIPYVIIAALIAAGASFLSGRWTAPSASPSTLTAVVADLERYVAADEERWKGHDQLRDNLVKEIRDDIVELKRSQEDLKQQIRDLRTSVDAQTTILLRLSQQRRNP